MEEIIKINLDRACRSCLSEDGVMEPVFSTEQTKQYSTAEMLLFCTKIEISENDGLPKLICEKCSSHIENAYTFKQQYEKNNEILQKYISQNSKALNIKQEATAQTPNLGSDIIDFNSMYNTDLNIKEEAVENLNNGISSNVKTDSAGSKVDLYDDEYDNEKSTQTDFPDYDQLFSCEHCDKKFISSEGLKIHRRRHTGTNLQHCPECDKSYTRGHHLQRHMALAHSTKVQNRFACKLCNASLTRLEHLKRHMAIHLKKRPFNCARCSLGFNREENLNKHLLTCCGKKEFTCEVCNKGFEKPEMLKAHMKTHEKPKTIQCLDTIDTQTFYENAELLYTEPDISVMNNMSMIKDEPDMDVDDYRDEAEHTEYAASAASNQDSTDDSDEEFEPNMKSSKAKPKAMLKAKVPGRKRGRPRKVPLDIVKTEYDEVTDITKIGMFPCTVCTKMLNTESGLNIHMRKHTAIRQHKCQICEKTFTRSNHLKRHEATHSMIKPYKCTVCEKGFNRMDHLNIHMYHHADKKPHECDICQKGFTRLEHLRNHKESRHGDTAKVKTDFCDVCKKGFTTAKYLQIHMRNHMVDKKFSCKICEKTFNCKSHLVEHNKSHSNEKPFLCSECGQRFIRNDYLVIHMRRHKGEKPYKCRYCGKGFPRATDLTVHERYHTGEKTHLCTICGKGFQRAYNLVVHMRVHTGEKPYVCPHCGKAFAQGNDLKAHVRRHTGERYNCELCGEGFIQGYHLTQHKRSAHGIESKSHIRRVEKLPQSQLLAINTAHNAVNAHRRNRKNPILTIATDDQDHGSVVLPEIVEQDSVLPEGMLQVIGPQINEIDLSNRGEIPPLVPMALFPAINQ